MLKKVDCRNLHLSVEGGIVEYLVTGQPWISSTLEGNCLSAHLPAKEQDVEKIHIISRLAYRQLGLAVEVPVYHFLVVLVSNPSGKPLAK